jgi:O-antigen ligase
VIIAATAIIAGILVSYSRMSLAAALVGFLLAALLAKRWIGAGLAAAMVALVVTASGPLRDRFFELDTDRVGQWTIALRVIASHFWLGAGDGRYLEVAIKVADGIAVPLVRTPHNSLLYAAATYGIFAGVALAVLYVMLVVEAVQRVRRCASPLAITRLTLVAAFLVHDVTNNLFFIPEVALMFWAVYAATEEPAAEEPAAKEPVTDAAVRPHR